MVWRLQTIAGSTDTASKDNTLRHLRQYVCAAQGRTPKRPQRARPALASVPHSQPLLVTHIDSTHRLTPHRRRPRTRPREVRSLSSNTDRPDHQIGYTNTHSAQCPRSARTSATPAGTAATLLLLPKRSPSPIDAMTFATGGCGRPLSSDPVAFIRSGGGRKDLTSAQGRQQVLTLLVGGDIVVWWTSRRAHASTVSPMRTCCTHYDITGVRSKRTILL